MKLSENNRWKRWRGWTRKKIFCTIYFRIIFRIPITRVLRTVKKGKLIKFYDRGKNRNFSLKNKKLFSKNSDSQVHLLSLSPRPLPPLLLTVTKSDSQISFGNETFQFHGWFAQLIRNYPRFKVNCHKRGFPNSILKPNCHIYSSPGIRFYFFFSFSSVSSGILLETRQSVGSKQSRNALFLSPVCLVRILQLLRESTF